LIFLRLDLQFASHNVLTFGALADISEANVVNTISLCNTTIFDNKKYHFYNAFLVIKLN
jgi:hypothetical protein